MTVEPGEGVRADQIPDQVPHDRSGLISYLEDLVSSDIAMLETQPDDPLAPLGQRVATFLGWHRVQSTTEVIDLLRSQSVAPEEPKPSEGATEKG